MMNASVPAEVLKKLKAAQSNGKLSWQQDTILKFLIPRAIFPASTHMRSWFIDDLIGEILCPQQDGKKHGMKKIFAARIGEYWQSLISRRGTQNESFLKN
jgi:hypothetical protein